MRPPLLALLLAALASPAAAAGALFSADGAFLGWSGPASWDASVLVADKPVPSNAADAAGKAITVRDFLNRAHRVHGEGKGVNADHYAWAQDNLRRKSGGREEHNFSYMADWSRKLNEGKGAMPSYAAFYEAKKDLELSKLDAVDGARAAVKAELDLLQGLSKDPTNGATQWRGSDLDSYEAHKDRLERAKRDVTVLEHYGLKGVYVRDYLLLKNKRLHIFFSVSRTPAG